MAICSETTAHFQSQFEINIKYIIITDPLPFFNWQLVFFLLIDWLERPHINLYSPANNASLPMTVKDDPARGPAHLLRKVLSM